MIKTFILDTNVLNDTDIFEHYMNIMPQERRNKVNKCAFQSNKNLTLGAGIVLAKALVDSLLERNIRETVSFPQLVFRYGDKGKPYFEQYPNLFFNLSHSGHYAVCSIGEREVGVDIEGGHEADLKIAKRFFTPDEYEWIESAISEAEKGKRFFRIWSLKESFLKATGMGLSLGLDSFSFTFHNTSECTDLVSVKYRDCGEQYHFKEYLVDDFSISVCSMEMDISDKLNFVSIEG